MGWGLGTIVEYPPLSVIWSPFPYTPKRTNLGVLLLAQPSPAAALWGRRKQQRGGLSAREGIRQTERERLRNTWSLLLLLPAQEEVDTANLGT